MTLPFVDLLPERENSLKTVTGALEKYLEQPHLLDPHLEDMMAVVMGRAKELVVKREEEVLAGSGGGSRGRPGEAFPFQVNVRMLTGCCRGFFARGIVCPTTIRRGRSLRMPEYTVSFSPFVEPPQKRMPFLTAISLSRGNTLYPADSSRSTRPCDGTSCAVLVIHRLA